MPETDPSLLAARLCVVRPITSHRTGEQYELTPVVLLESDEERRHQIVRICNEPLIYSTLFDRILDGRPYGHEKAGHFFEWGSAGWEVGTHFVYALIDGEGRLAGAIDIKSPALASAEIGYWLSAHHSGIMTNAVEALAGVARDAGFHALHALVDPANERSARVLLRAGFEPTGAAERNGRTFNRYERRL